MGEAPDPFATAAPPEVPVPSARRRRRVWPWLALAAVAGAVGAAAWLAAAVYLPASRHPSAVTLTIPPGESSTQISRRLQQAGVVRSAQLFQLYAYVTGRDDRLQAGEYRLPGNENLEALLRRLTAARKHDELTLTVVEGWSNRELAEYLAGSGVVSQEEFFRVVQRRLDWWEEYDFLRSRPADRDLEGFLFPDTYRVFVGSAAETIVRKMLDNFGRKLTPQLRAEIARQGKTIYEVLTLASIVEREVPDGPDRPKVAGIFLHRLAIGMPLQSDATVNYVTGKKVTRPSADDLRTESLYNTYIHAGLPPGPINNPGLSAIRAVLSPEPSPYLFYLTTPEGAVIYSRTHEEHVAAKARYYQ